MVSIVPRLSRAFLDKPNATLILLARLPGASQYSASSGVTAITRIFGSSGLSHHTLAGIDQSSLIFFRSELIAADRILRRIFVPGGRRMRGTLWETCESHHACEHARRRANRSFLLRVGQKHPLAGNEAWCRSR